MSSSLPHPHPPHHDLASRLGIPSTWSRSELALWRSLGGQPHTHQGFASTAELGVARHLCRVHAYAHQASRSHAIYYTSLLLKVEASQPRGVLPRAHLPPREG
eukprot:1084114-Prorocentrum_minimum.AAC.1